MTLYQITVDSHHLHYLILGSCGQAVRIDLELSLENASYGAN
jgi:hypothetical protein